jgi:polar amino acid transport system substrate-binding protein
MNLYVLKAGDFSFGKNIIENDGWLVILKGLEVTLLISISALLIGTVIGALLCFMRNSKVGALKSRPKLL